jgi:hypothetical protein
VPVDAARARRVKALAPMWGLAVRRGVDGRASC